MNEIKMAYKLKKTKEWISASNRSDWNQNIKWINDIKAYQLKIK